MNAEPESGIFYLIEEYKKSTASFFALCYYYCRKMAYNNTKKKYIRIKHIEKSSPAYAAGIREGDFVTAVNGESIEDELDFNFFSSHEKLDIQIKRRDRIENYLISRRPGEFLGIEFAGVPIKRCFNRCVFCFIDQLPVGLRKSLYLKDEDYRHSFLHGNYITLTGITQKEMKKIIRLGLSPLYISVHSTDPAVRIRMLNNSRAGSITAQLRELESDGIAFHTQIVVCPQINDGKVLEKTINDLLAFKDGLLSIAVVPVGITKHRKSSLKPVSARDARNICRMVDTIGERNKKNTGRRRVFIADEFLLKAGLDIPESSYYEDYPQIENGVGLISILLNEWKGVRKNLRKKIEKVKRTTTKPSSLRKKRYLLLTSVSAQPFAGEIISELGRLFDNVDLTVEPVLNRFLGETVTVAGLITAHDIIHTVKKSQKQWDAVIIPGVILNYRGYTLDGFSTARIAKNIGTEVNVANNIPGLYDFILESTHEQKRR